MHTETYSVDGLVYGFLTAHSRMQFTQWFLDATHPYCFLKKMFIQLFYCALFSNKIQIYIPVKINKFSMMAWPNH